MKIEFLLKSAVLKISRFLTSSYEISNPLIQLKIKKSADFLLIEFYPTPLAKLSTHTDTRMSRNKKSFLLIFPPSKNL